MKVDNKSRAERFAEKWFTEHGYTFNCKSRCKSKATFTVCDNDGFEITWVLLRDSKGMEFVMEMFQNGFEMKKGQAK